MVQQDVPPAPQPQAQSDEQRGIPESAKPAKAKVCVLFHA